MKKQKFKKQFPTIKRPSLQHSLSPLFERVRALIQTARRAAATSINTLQVLTNFEIGRLIVHQKQQGQLRAEYGEVIINILAKKLTVEFGRGFSKRNLEYMRQFYVEYRNRPQQIAQKPIAQLPWTVIAQKASAQSPSPSSPIHKNPAGKSGHLFTLSWSHYVMLLSIKDPSERSFYEIESTQAGWSIPELKRQMNSSLYERLALSRNKKGVRLLATKGQVVQKPQDILKSPLVLDFLGMDEKPCFSENDLESAIIDKLQHFLLELGKGFLFEARQKRFTFDEDHFFVDLVFYNRLLRCYVLVDLKQDKLTHQDLGQMQMYVNHYDRNIKTANENPTIGILLCKRKKDALIKLTLPKNANIFASRYQLYLPSKKELSQHLREWTDNMDT